MSSSSLLRDRQQVKALSVLRRAQGGEVTYDELREAGVQFPVTAISDLERSGVPVERGRWIRQVSWRLDPRCDAVPIDPAPTQELEALPDVEASPEWGQVHVYNRHPASDAVQTVGAHLTGPSLRLRQSAQAVRARLIDLSVRLRQRARATGARLTGPSLGLRGGVQATAARRPAPLRHDRPSEVRPVNGARVLSGLALLAAASIVAILALSPFHLGPSASQTTAQRVNTAQRGNTAPSVHPARVPATVPSQSASTSHRSTVHPVSRSTHPTGSAVALEARGHALLQSGQYASAISILRQAVQATGERPGACTQPTSQNCLTYAFGLYDLGVALAHDGDPAAAVPVLKLRLGINDARSAVATELQLAQSTASPASPSALEVRGHALLQSGQYASAIPVLRQAVQATGERPGGCTEPTDQNCLTYAFGLYDLGVALAQNGDPAAAVPILKLRLGINNQRGAVAQELQRAQSAAS